MRREDMRSDLKRTHLGKSEEGMTLMELIIVITILGLLTVALGISVINKMGESKDKIAIIEIGQLEGALQLYSFDVGHFPSTAEGLQALVQNPAGIDSWKGPYVKKGVPSDPWSKPYAYKSPGDHGDYDLFSFGADGEGGNEDDICSWK
jgi:general secretion pathway protein G